MLKDMSAAQQSIATESHTLGMYMYFINMAHHDIKLLISACPYWNA